MDWRDPLALLFPGLAGGLLHTLWRRNDYVTGREAFLATGTGSYTGSLAALSRLVDQGLVQARQAGQATQYRLNRDHLAFPALDAAFTAYAPEADLDQRFRSLLESLLNDRLSEASLAYFGSYAREEAGLESDIDLLFVLPESVGTEEADSLVEALETHGRHWTGNPVQVYLARPSDLHRAVTQNDPMVREWEVDARTIVGEPIQQLLRATP